MATNAYADANKVIAARLSGPKPIITVFAEENGPIGNGNYEFSFGNGNLGYTHGLGGCCMSAPGRIIRACLSVVAKEKPETLNAVKVNMVVNRAEHTDFSAVKMPAKRERL